MSYNLDLATISESSSNIAESTNDRLGAVDSILSAPLSVVITAADPGVYVKYLTHDEYIGYSTFVLTDEEAWVNGTVNHLLVPNRARGLFCVVNDAWRPLTVATITQMEKPISLTAPVAGNYAPVITGGTRGLFFCDGISVELVGSNEHKINAFVHSPLASDVVYSWTSRLPFRLMEDDYLPTGSSIKREIWTVTAGIYPSTLTVYDLAVNAVSQGSLILPTSGTGYASINVPSDYVEFAANSVLTITSPSNVYGAGRVSFGGSVLI